MIDFNNATYVKLSEISIGRIHKGINSILVDNESVLSAYQGMRDSVVFTDRRVITVNVQGITGKKLILLHYLIRILSSILLKLPVSLIWMLN